MFDVSWGELLIVGTVALVVIGPKDLPRALRALGQTTAKLRKMANEFQTQFNEAMREAELEDIRKNISSATDVAQSFNPLQTIKDEIKGAIDSTGETKPTSQKAPVDDRLTASLPDVPALPDAQAVIADAAAKPAGEEVGSQQTGQPAKPASSEPVDLRPKVDSAAAKDEPPSARNNAA